MLLISTFAGAVSAYNPKIAGLVGIFFFLCSLMGGLSAGRLFSFLHGSDRIGLWLCMNILPIAFGGCLLLIDICEYFETERTHILTFSEGLTFILLFMGVNFPMTFIGIYAGYRCKPIEPPTRINRVPRSAPVGLPWFLDFNLMWSISGLVPIFVIGFELYQILSCIRGSSYIHLMYWSFYLGFFVFIVVVAQISIAQTYLLMCYEDYQWWWRSWLLGSSTSVVTFLLLTNYLALAMKVTQLTTLVVYAVFIVILSSSIGLMSGSIALMASFLFNLAIFKRARRAE